MVIFYFIFLFFYFSLSAKMAGDILVVKANLDKVLLGPSIEPDQDDENEKSDDDF